MHIISKLLDYDTALSELQLLTDNLVPSGFKKETFTTVVWDNNDFCEDTPSGKNTTHGTNGIIIQRKCDIEETETMPCINLPKSRQHTLALPSEEVEFFCRPKRHEPNIEIIESISRQNEILINSKQIVDIAYIMCKLPAVYQVGLASMHVCKHMSHREAKLDIYL